MEHPELTQYWPIDIRPGYINNAADAPRLSVWRGAERIGLVVTVDPASGYALQMIRSAEQPKSRLTQIARRNTHGPQCVAGMCLPDGYRERCIPLQVITGVTVKQDA